MTLKLFEEQDCIECGVRFGVPEGYTARRLADRKSFCCPNGHSMAYVESTADKLRRERDQLVQRMAQKDDELRDKRAEIDRQRGRVELETTPRRCYGSKASGAAVFGGVDPARMGNALVIGLVKIRRRSLS